MSNLTSDACAAFRTERRPDMEPRELVDLAFDSVRIARGARIRRAYGILANCRDEYGEAFEAVLRDRQNLLARYLLLRAARRYRWVTWILTSPGAARGLTAWRFAVGGEPTRADRKAA